ncbi:hypothetical protein KKG63_02855 [Patescibacteria group bacterium]|nr:hypothetical protein [Patescibacteria group bacterium]
MTTESKVMVSVYLACALLFGAVVVVNGPANLERTLFRPLDNSYSILGSKSVFKDYLGGQKVYAFLPYWSLGDHELNLNHITDLSYFGLNVDARGRIIRNDGPYRVWRENKQLATALKSLKKAGAQISVTLVCHDDDDIDALLNCPTCWKTLARDVETELSWAGIKDLNVDFEYSGYTSPANAQKYSQLVDLLNKHLDAALGDSFVVVSTYADAVEQAGREEVRLTDPKSLALAADAIFIMAYDFHRPTSGNAGPVSPLEGLYNTTQLNLTKMLETYLTTVSASKLILGLPFYGYDWVVADGSPMSDRVEGSDYLGYSTSRTYAQITDQLVKKQIRPLWDDRSKTPYYNYVDEETGSQRQVWYDNEESLKYKIGLAGRHNLLGIGVWALGFEGGYSDLWQVFKLPI